MREQLKRAQDKLGQTWDEYKAFRDGLPKNEKQWTSEQREKFDRMDDEIDRLEGEINRLKRSINDGEREERFHQSGSPDAINFAPPIDHRGMGAAGYQAAPDTDNFNFRADPHGRTVRHSFNRYLEGGDRAISPEEFRSMQAGADIGGGFLNAPEKFVRQLIKSLDNEVFIRRKATCFDLKHNESMGAPVLDTDLDDSEWTTELATGSEDDMTFGKRELRPYPTAKRIKVSNKLLRTAALNPETIVRNRMAYKFGVTEEKAFMTGDGVGKPLGLFTPSSDGISTARDVAGDNTTTAIKADTLIDVAFSIKGQYAKKAEWIFSRDAIRMIRKLKDGNGEYLWQRGLAGAPNTILERPYSISEYCPSTFTAGGYVGLFGDLSFFWIATGLDVQIQRLNELYAEQNITGFIGRLELDGAPVLEEAFTRIKLADA